MGWLENLDRAAGAGVCHLLSNGGNAVLAGGIVSAALVPGGQVPALAAGLGLVALNAGCSFDPNTRTGREDLGGWYGSADGCTVRLTLWNKDGIKVYQEGWVKIDEFYIDGCTSGGADRCYFVRGIKANLGGNRLYQIAAANPGSTWETLPTGGDCGEPAPPPPIPDMPVYEYDGSTSNDCSMSVQVLGWDVKDDGRVDPVVKITPTAPLPRADSPVIGGCNFEPVIYIGQPGGRPDNPPVVIPYVPKPDEPDGTPHWVKDVVKTHGGPSLDEIERVVVKHLPDVVAGSTYRLTSVCEVDADGNSEQVTISKQVATGASIPALISRLDALPDLLQGLKDFKQPTCPKAPKQAGRQVTVLFRQVGAGLTRPLDKVLRYRALGGADLGAHTAHWEHFQWEAGPVCVISKGLEWGVPQVWAATEAEGKRVIQHAADIAGVNLNDGRHQWIVTASSGIRTGRGGRMALDRRRGVLGVSMRDGSSGSPLRAVDVAPHLAP